MPDSYHSFDPNPEYPLKILIRSVLDDGRGQIHQTPSGTVLQYGSFFFPQCSARDTRALLEKQNPEAAELIFPLNQEIPQGFASLGEKQSRYLFAPLDWSRWAPANVPVPKTRSLRLREATANDYHRVCSQEWSRDLVAQIPPENFAQGGFTLLMEESGWIIGGAGIYARWQNHIEIEIDVREDHQGRGLGAWIAREYLKGCRERDLVPHWDAMTGISRDLALKSGFTGVQAYEMIRWKPRVTPLQANITK